MNQVGRFVRVRAKADSKGILRAADSAVGALVAEWNALHGAAQARREVELAEGERAPIE